MSRLRVESLRFHHLGPFDLSLVPGECAGLAGPSGSGKTLFLRAIADLDPNDGRAFLDGVARDEMPPPEWRRRVAMLPAEPVWWYDTVAEHFRDLNASRWLARLGFEEDVLARDVRRLSSGERQRLALARLLARGPRVLLLDEPTASLDAENARRVEALLADYRRETEAPILWVAHDEEQLRRVAQRSYDFCDGRFEERMRP